MEKLGEDHDCVWKDRALELAAQSLPSQEQFDKLADLVKLQQGQINVSQDQLQAVLDNAVELSETVEKQRQTLAGVTKASEKQKQDLENELIKVKAELTQLKRFRYGRRSEKIKKLKREIKKAQRHKADPQKTKELREKNRQGRLKLEEQTTIYRVQSGEQDCQDCGTHLRATGRFKEKVSFDLIPARLVRRVSQLEELSCSKGCGSLFASGPITVTKSGMYSAGFISHVIVGKASDCAPLYRQEKQFKRWGIPVNRSTLSDLLKEAAYLLKPLYQRALELIATQKIVLADETPIRVLPDKKEFGSKQGYFWAFVTSTVINLIGYVFSISRSGETPKNILGASQGTLVIDGYTGYNTVIKPECRERAGCWAHARRYVFDSLETAEKEAKEAIDYIWQLYEVEHDALEKKIVGTTKHLKLRQKRSKRILADFKSWLLQENGKHLPQGPMGKAITYILNQWNSLTLFVTDSQIPLDNNQSENALRIVALGRKNYMFLGNEEAGERQAIFYTLVKSCEANGINPQQYLTDVLIRISTTPMSKIDDLLPNHWKPPG